MTFKLRRGNQESLVLRGTCIYLRQCFFQNLFVFIGTRAEPLKERFGTSYFSIISMALKDNYICTLNAVPSCFLAIGYR